MIWWKRESTDANLQRRVTDVETELVVMKNYLDKGIYVMQRIQWTLTGLVLYFILDSEGGKDVAKALLKLLL